MSLLDSTRIAKVQAKLLSLGFACTCVTGCIHVQAEEIEEHHRRDGFEVGNADKIFDSTGAGQKRPVEQPMASYGTCTQMDPEDKELKEEKEELKTAAQ